MVIRGDMNLSDWNSFCCTRPSNIARKRIVQKCYDKQLMTRHDSSFSTETQLHNLMQNKQCYIVVLIGYTILKDNFCVS